MILLDTDVMVDLLRKYPPAIAWLTTLREDIVLPGFVVMELIHGCKNKAEQLEVESKIRAYGVAWPDPATCDKALGTFARHHLRYKIGILDALIGQMAVALRSPLYTFNQKHYSSIPHLQTVQPYMR